MVTELQQKIIDEINKYSSLENAKEKAEKIATQLGCSPAYVKKLIKKESDSSTKIQIKVAPPKSESESEVDPESEEIDEVFDLDEDAEDDWNFDDEVPDDEVSDESDSGEPKETPAAEMPLDQILSKENVEELISVPFRMAADFTGWDGAELTATEKKRLTPMARAIMLKYVPDLMQKYMVEIVFCLVAGEIVVAKYRAYSIFAEEQESKKKAQEKATKQAEIEENRRLQMEQEEAARKTAETPSAPEIEESGRPLTKEDAGNPSWNQPGGIGS